MAAGKCDTKRIGAPALLSHFLKGRCGELVPKSGWGDEQLCWLSRQLHTLLGFGAWRHLGLGVGGRLPGGQEEMP